MPSRGVPGPIYRVKRWFMRVQRSNIRKIIKIKIIIITMTFKKRFWGSRGHPWGPWRSRWAPGAPYKLPRGAREARDEREVFISGRHYLRQDTTDSVITRPCHRSVITSLLSQDSQT